MSQQVLLCAIVQSGSVLEQSIRSVLLQGYPRLEFIVIDGRSSDDSIKTIARYETWIKHWVSEPDSGPADALNKGFGVASGDIFGFLNADDFYLPGCLEKVAAGFHAHPSADVVARLFRKGLGRIGHTLVQRPVESGSVPLWRLCARAAGHFLSPGRIRAGQWVQATITMLIRGHGLLSGIVVDSGREPLVHGQLVIASGGGGSSARLGRAYDVYLIVSKSHPGADTVMCLKNVDKTRRMMRHGMCAPHATLAGCRGLLSFHRRSSTAIANFSTHSSALR